MRPPSNHINNWKKVSSSKSKFKANENGNLGSWGGKWELWGLGLGQRFCKCHSNFPLRAFHAEKQETHGKHALLIKFEQGKDPAPFAAFLHRQMFEI